MAVKDLHALIEQRLAEYPSEDDVAARWLAPLAQRLTLPLDVGWTHAVGIRPDGELILFSHEDEVPVLRIEEDPHQRWIALVLGSSKYPELEAMLPARMPMIRTVRCVTNWPDPIA